MISSGCFSIYSSSKGNLTVVITILVALVVKKHLPMQVDLREMGLIPVLGRSPGEGLSIPLQYSCLENSMDRGAWWATVNRVGKRWT